MSLLPRLFFFLSLLLCAVAVANAATPVGAWSPITDLSNPYVTEIAKFAVNEYSKTTNGVENLTLEKVIKGWTQVVDDTNYRLVLAVKDGHSTPATTADYETVVFDNRREHRRRLVSFLRHPDNLPVVGAWKPTENVNGTHVTEVAEFAVAEYNKDYKEKLKLEIWLTVRVTVWAGGMNNYLLVLTAKNETVPTLPAKKYEAAVSEKGHYLRFMFLIPLEE